MLWVLIRITGIHNMILCFKAKTLLLAVYYSTIRSLSSQLVPNSVSFTRYRDIAYHVAGDTVTLLLNNTVTAF